MKNPNPAPAMKTTTPAAPATSAAPAALAALALAFTAAPAPAADIYWGGGDGDVINANWFRDATLTPPATPPLPNSAAHINNGRVTIASGLTVTTTAGTFVFTASIPPALAGTEVFSRYPVTPSGTASAVIYAAAGSIGAAAGSSGTAAVAGTWDNKSDLIVGGAGTGVLDITGTVKAVQTFIGRATGGSGTVAINNGLMQTAGWLHVGGIHSNDSADLGAAAANANAGAGHLYIGRTGTLAVGASGMRVAYGNVNATGTVVVDGVLKNTGYIQIGQWGQGALIVGRTGTVAATTNIFIGGGDGATAASGTAFIDGRLIAGTTFYVAANRSQAAVTIGAHGWVTATTEGGVGGAGGTTAGTAANGTLNVEAGGRLEVKSNMHVGRNGGQGLLDISGTVTTGNLRIAYGSSSVAVATSTLTSGTVLVRAGGYLQTAYMQVGQWGKGRLSIEEGATVRSTDYIIVGQGDDSRARLGAEGCAYVAGQLSSINAFTVGGYTDKAVLDIARTGRVTGNANFTIGNQAGSSGTVNVAGHLHVQGVLTNANNGRGALNITRTGTVNVAGNYTQKGAGALTVDLDPARATPYLAVGGVATLSGTLNITGFTGTASSSIAKASQIPADSSLVIRAADGFSGNFGAINNLGAAAGPSYITFAGSASSGSDYRVRYVLAGTVDLAAGKTFEIDIPLTDTPFSSKWDGKSLIKTGAGTLIYSATATPYTGVTLVNGGILKFTNPNALTTLRGDLINNSLIDLATPTAAGHRTLRVPRLFGTGTLRLTIDSAARTSDQLQIVGHIGTLQPALAEGSQHLILTDIRSDGAAATAADLAALTLITLPATGANDAAYTGGLASGALNYTPQKRSDGTVGLGLSGLSTTGEIIYGMAGAQSLSWFGQQDNLGRRFGDLRAQPSRGGLWARAFAEGATIDAAVTGRAFDLDLYGITAGADKAWTLPAGRLHAGAFAGYGLARQKFDSAAGTGDADGESKLLTAGLYAAWLRDAGWFANAVLAWAGYDNDFTARDQSGTAVTAAYKDWSAALSLELGRRLALKDGWFAEPSVRLSLARLARDDYRTRQPDGQPGLAVANTSADILRARAGALAGRAFTSAHGGLFQFHGRLGGVYENSAGGEVRLPGVAPCRPNLDGGRVEAGAGLLWQPSAAAQLYFDYDAALGTDYKKPWSLSLGLRHAF
jgi:outer membrane autotransporter protein